MPAWDRFITERDRQVFTRSGYGKRAGFGVRPAVLVIDVTHQFIGDRPEPILESIVRWPQSSGEDGWRAVANIKALLAEARGAKVPVFYTTPLAGPRGARGAEKSGRRSELDDRADRNTIPSDIAPGEGDLVIRKERPSAFFGTPLVTYLTERGVDSVFITGGTTSGCVRASVIDAFSYGYKVAVVEECLFDRGEASHAMNLFDMQQKYADVVSINDAVAQLRSLAPR
ncbi:MAG TPA: isochorismatase family protein [Candidatus Limnocylindria bacterium]|nr:isochorismatase family protein [Candidatus Limnocylindria bacterium]